MEKIVALSCVFGLGMCFSLLGSISIKLMPRLKIDQGRFGTLISAFMLTCLAASFIVGVTIDRISYKPVAIFGFVMTSMCIFSLARGKTFMTVFTSCLLLGFGAMALNIAGNTMIPIVLFGGTNAVAASNLGNAFFGLGLFLTPLIVSFLFRKTSYEKGVSVIGLIVLSPVIVAIFSSYPESNAGFVFIDSLALLKEPAVLIAAITLFFYISLESSFCNWMPVFGKEVIDKANPEADPDATDASSQRLLSLFAVAMMAGRLIASQIPVITEYGVWFIAGASLIVGFIILGMSVIKVFSLAQLLAVLAGLAFAPCFPTTIGVIFSKHPENFGSVFGIIFAFGLLGAVIVPKAIGNLAKGSSVQKSFKLLIVPCVLLVISALILGRT